MAAAVRVLAAGELSRYQTTGKSEVSRFEEELAAKFGASYALAVNSGTSALICALVGAGVGPGDEVLVPGYTWVSSAAAPLAVGAVPILVDIDDTLTIDPADLEAKITPRTKAAIVVHMNNLVCDMDRIMDIAQRRKLLIIEDACQAFGVKYHGRRVGTIGHAGAFSFNQHKNIVSGEGGALVTNDEHIYVRGAMYHDVGSYTRAERIVSDEPLFVGVNLRMPELSAAVLRPQLRRIDQMLRAYGKRRKYFLTKFAASNWDGWRPVPHNDPQNAVGLAIQFDDVAHAQEFGARRGVTRLADSGRHIFSNWESIIGQRTFHERFSPFGWFGEETSYSAENVPATRAILGRSCIVNTFRELPDMAWRRLAARLAASR